MYSLIYAASRPTEAAGGAGGPHGLAPCAVAGALPPAPPGDGRAPSAGRRRPPDGTEADSLPQTLQQGGGGRRSPPRHPALASPCAALPKPTCTVRSASGKEYNVYKDSFTVLDEDCAYYLKYGTWVEFEWPDSQRAPRPWGLIWTKVYPAQRGRARARPCAYG